MRIGESYVSSARRFLSHTNTRFNVTSTPTRALESSTHNRTIQHVCVCAPNIHTRKFLEEIEKCVPEAKRDEGRSGQRFKLAAGRDSNLLSIFQTEKEEEGETRWRKKGIEG